MTCIGIWIILDLALNFCYDSAKMDELNQIPTKLIDFEMIGKIIDATIEEDCEIEPCPDGNS